MTILNNFWHDLVLSKYSGRNILTLAFVVSLSFCSSVFAQSTDQRPNILLITADDMGYTDIGSFGGEIRTPNLDDLAMSGVRLSNFHVGPACSQTRTMLMSGTYFDVGGVSQGRARVLSDDVVALPQYMQDAGYHTYMAGKWHLGTGENQNPKAEGFESSFVLNTGVSEHFYFGANASTSSPYMEDGVPAEFPEGAYSSQLYADKMLAYMKENEGDGKPFFAWFTPTAPHWPIQVPEDYMESYRGVYDGGWDELIIERLERADEMGVLTQGYSLENYPRTNVHWDTLSEEQQAYEARTMELYAGMIENLDFHVGRIVDYLKEIGEYENTIIIFSSDNGAEERVTNSNANNVDNSYENLGNPDSYIYVGGWADAHSAPYRNQKGTQTEGGIRAPAFISYPALENKGSVDDALVSIMDFKPTFVELASGEVPTTLYQGREITPVAGISFADMVLGHGDLPERPAPLWYSQALYDGTWKLMWIEGVEQWQLFNISEDPSETKNLADEHPDILSSMLAQWRSIGNDAGYTLGPEDALN